ncbi:MAG: SRPBCC family protein [Bacteroidota bacterium]|nr:SRPBCC family protein [Bacteroidota bacterium]
MYSFDLSIEINQPIEKVMELYQKRILLPQWQPGLVLDDKITSKTGELQYKMTFGSGRRKLVITETILRNDLPEHYDVRFELKGIINHVQNTFVPLSPSVTKWTSHVEYQFKGLKNLIATYMRSNFENQSGILMRNFKGFAETHR